MRHSPNYTLACSILCSLLVSACSSSARLDITIKDTEQGAVYVERSRDTSLQAAHPIAVAPRTIARILRGIATQEEPGFLRKLAGGKTEPVNVFREEEIEFLAPLLSEGLATAAPDQQVGFRIGQARASADKKVGSLYAYGRSLYVTLPWITLESRYGAGGSAPVKTLVFAPESARRPDSYRRGSSPDPTIIVDYELLAALPDAPPAPAQPVAAPSGTTPAAASAPAAAAPPGTDQELRALQDQMRQKNEELEELRKEMQDIRRQLNETSSTTKPAKPKPKPAPQDSR